VSGVRVAPPVLPEDCFIHEAVFFFYYYLCKNIPEMKVDLFVPCFIDQLYPQTAFNVIKLLEFAGVSVHYNPEQTCCGQPAFNTGFWKEARSLAVKFLHDFDGAEKIVGPSASCTSYIKNYFHLLFKEDPENLQKVEKIGDSIYELTDILVNILKVNDFGAVFPHRVTWHDACTALREYGIREEPRILLRHVKGLELVEMEETNICCGFGGTFSVKFKTISSAMTQQKVENALKTGAEYIASTESSCLMNLESYIRKNNIPLKTIHITNILASGW
jgi:L-lactate dehydrogenase complex protein LldE